MFDRYWQISVPYTGGGGNIQVTTVHQGLWHRCQTTDQLGTSSCDRYYQSIAHLPTSLIGQRALICISLILSAAGLAAGVASTDSVNMANSSKDKATGAKAAGVAYIASGIFALGAVTWAAAIIINNNKLDMITHNPAMSGQVYFTLGTDIYIGWVAGSLGLISGVLFLMSGCKLEEENEYEGDTTMQYNSSHPAYEKGYASSNQRQQNEYL